MSSWSNQINLVPKTGLQGRVKHQGHLPASSFSHYTPLMTLASWLVWAIDAPDWSGLHTLKNFKRLADIDKQYPALFSSDEYQNPCQVTELLSVYSHSNQKLNVISNHKIGGISPTESEFRELS